MNCSKEEIEQKRLIALQRREQARLNAQKTPDIKNFRSNVSPTVSNVKSNEIRQSYNNNFQHRNGTSSTPRRRANQKGFTGNAMYNNKPKDRFDPISTRSFFSQKQIITAKCYMITNERFTLETSSFFPPLIENLKTISSRAYDMKTKTWNFNIKDYELLMEKISRFKSDICVTGLPKTVLQMFRKSVNPESNNLVMDLSRIDPTLLQSLMPFQRDGICYGVSKGGRCMIADDMGLGKTIQALGIAHYFKENWPLLIVVPSSVRYQWSDAIYNFLPSVPSYYIHHFTSGKDFVDDDKIIITSYDLLVRAIDSFEKRIFGFVILDESHILKSIKTARYKAVQRVVSQARHVVLLSGTPALSRPIELYTQINMIMPNFMGYQEYGIRYCAGAQTAYGWDFAGSSNMLELQMLLKNCCVLRRLKGDVLHELPSKNREVIMLDPNLIKAGTKSMKEMSKKLECTGMNGVESHNALLQYYNQTSIAKQKAVCDHISKLFENKKKCLIFAHHQNLMKAICELAESMDIKYIRIDGKTNPERRKYQVDKFQNSEDYIAAVLSITAANAGITLTAAQLVVFAELFWNPGILCQAEDRVHRIGQNDDVVIQYLVAQQTADDYLWPLIQQKMKVLNKAGLDQDFCLDDARVTKQGLDKKQLTLTSFMEEKDSEDENEEHIVQSDVPESSTANSTQDYKKLLELDEEDFMSCDWDMI